MPDPDTILATKSVSALLDGAKMGRLSKMILGWDGQISSVLSKKMIGGQWINGKALIKTGGFEFQPSKLNQPFFKNLNDLTIVIPWSELNSISKRFGVVGTIVDLQTSADRLSIRCHGADALIETIEAARGAV